MRCFRAKPRRREDDRQHSARAMRLTYALPLRLRGLARNFFLHKARDGAALRGLIGEFDLYIVDIAPAPAFRRVVTLDDRMFGAAVVLRRVLVGRGVAAADMTAGAAESQMHPSRATLETLL